MTRHVDPITRRVTHAAAETWFPGDAVRLAMPRFAGYERADGRGWVVALDFERDRVGVMFASGLVFCEAQCLSQPTTTRT